MGTAVIWPKMAAEMREFARFSVTFCLILSPFYCFFSASEVKAHTPTELFTAAAKKRFIFLPLL